MLNIKSNYVCKLIFKNIKLKRFLQLIKYNKKIQTKLNKTMADYKDYNQIEIELKLSDYDKKDKFINIDEKNKPFIHIYIYINNNKYECQNPSEINSKIEKIRINLDYELNSLKGLFKKCYSLKEINFIKCNRKDIIDISEMFSGCRNLSNLNLFNFKTDKVKDMSYLFYECL